MRDTPYHLKAGRYHPLDYVISLQLRPFLAFQCNIEEIEHYEWPHLVQTAHK